MKLHQLFYAVLILVTLSNCAGSNIDNVLKQGDVVQENFKTTIPFTYVNGWMVLEVEIRDKAYNFILDTGSSNIVTTEFAEALNLKVLGAEDIEDVNDTKNSTEYATIDNVTIGNVDFKNTITGIADLNKITEISCTKIHGLLGSNLMRKAVWDFDFQNQTITIANDESKLGIPTETIDSKMYIGTAGIPSITLKINGQKVLNNKVDFGNGGTNLLRGDYFIEQREEGLITNYVKGSQKAFGGFGRTEAKPFYHTMINELQIGNHKVNNLFTTVKSGAGNNLGLAFFKNYRVILNWNKKKIRMIEVTKAGNDTYNSYGFSTFYNENGVAVNAVIEASSASKVLQQGDKILSINHINYANITDEEYCSFYRDGYDNGKETLAITILRNDEELSFQLLKTKLL
ncbi:aspartyl protease family protein [uncultured Winogradskyella sp.]|uniref:aspartyl protease family protein n=1 Tax=uncultured Winogradskyella sp. TaxID=395353 RepID=UPI00260A01CB|nr:aspartyl protease family protein [uncultured Winogradskyella sp.]